MKQHPILFRSEMVKAILEGRKTQTRRPIKHFASKTLKPLAIGSPYGEPGDRLWVRETWRPYEDPKTCIDGVLFKADGIFKPIRNSREAADKWLDARGDKGTTVWRPSIFMPRWACRLKLEITKIRVERLCSITDADAQAEGIPKPTCDRDDCLHHVRCGGASWSTAFKLRFQKMHKQEPGWNPWLWVIDFRRAR